MDWATAHDTQRRGAKNRSCMCEFNKCWGLNSVGQGAKVEVYGCSRQHSWVWACSPTLASWVTPGHVTEVFTVVSLSMKHGEIFCVLTYWKTWASDIFFWNNCIFILFLHRCSSVYMGVTAHMWSSEDNLKEVCFLFAPGRPTNQTQFVRFGSKHFNQRSHLACLRVVYK